MHERRVKRIEIEWEDGTTTTHRFSQHSAMDAFIEEALRRRWSQTDAGGTTGCKTTTEPVQPAIEGEP